MERSCIIPRARHNADLQFSFYFFFFWIVTFRIATLKDWKVKYFIWKKKILLKSKSLRKKNSFSAWNAVLEHPHPFGTLWIASPRKNPAYGPDSLFFKHCYKKVIFDKGLRAKALGGWRKRKICSLKVALTRCWTHVEGKDISQIWDETLVLIKWLNNVRIPLWSFRVSNWICTKRAWNKSFWLTMIYFELNV